MNNVVLDRVSNEKGIPPPAREEKDPENGVENDLDRMSPGSVSMSSTRWAVLCSSMLLAEMQAALDSTMTADLQPSIIDTFGQITKFPWINVTYSLGMGGSCLLW